MSVFNDPAWDYQPTAPFQFHDVVGTPRLGQSDHLYFVVGEPGDRSGRGLVDSFERTMETFLRKYLPVEQGTRCVWIEDSAGKCILGYAVDGQGNAPAEWHGIQKSFEWLTEHGAASPVERLDWEMTAKRQAW